MPLQRHGYKVVASPYSLALNEFAIGIQFHQLVGHLFNAFFNFRGRPSPTAPAQLIHLRRVAFRALVTLDLIEAIERHIQCVASGKLENEIVTLKVLHRQAAKPFVARDAVLNVDDVIADLQVVQGREECGRLAFLRRAVTHALGKQFLFRDDGQTAFC